MRMTALWLGAFSCLAVAQEDKSPALAPAAGASRRVIVGHAATRQIDDPNSGLSWLLFEDQAHPGGPGKLIAQESQAGKTVAPVTGRANQVPVIRAGDRVQLEEHSPAVDASLQGLALSSAAQGKLLRVQLRIGGRVVKARALGPGRVVLELAGGRP